MHGVFLFSTGTKHADSYKNLCSLCRWCICVLWNIIYYIIIEYAVWLLNSQLNVNIKFHFWTLRRTESNFEYSVYCKTTNKNTILHFLSFHDKKNTVLSGSCTRALRVWIPINLSSEIQFLLIIFSNLGYPKFSLQ